jgi:hypothetical protein
MPRGRKMTEAGRIKLGKRVELNKKVMDILTNEAPKWAAHHEKPYDKALAIWTCLMDNGLDITPMRRRLPWRTK